MFEMGSRQRELDALRIDLDRLRSFAEALEARIAEASREATSFAEQGLAQQQSSMRGEFEQLRNFVETRAQTHENLVRAMLSDADARFNETLEIRLALAAREAKAAAAEAHQQSQAGWREEIDRLRGFVEARAQTQENLVRAMLAAADTRIAEALEPRIEVAARAATAFAEQGLMQQQAALRTLGRRVAEIARERAAEPPAAWIAPAPPAAAAYLIGACVAEAEGFRRLEIRDEPEALFLADLADLPIPPGGATRLTLAHVVEFVATERLEQTLLPHWRERLAPGGELAIVTLDGPAWTAALARDADDFDRLAARLAAQGRRPVRNLFDRRSLAGLLKRAGLAVVEDESEAGEAALTVVARAPT